MRRKRRQPRDSSLAGALSVSTVLQEAFAGRAFSFPAQENLSAADVGQIIAQAAAQANAQGAAATIAVVDRVGNVLGVFRMPGAPLTARVSEAPNGDNIDIQGLDVPSETTEAHHPWYSPPRPSSLTIFRMTVCGQLAFRSGSHCSRSRTEFRG